ncbi:TonB-dependent receptor [Sphingobium boeckii]|uniref:Iron complex outermembrane receptor protein n=1 Tax=Sphingobium boeckii TaxID=1082345 RepID=A0A7W9AFR3_9SPHN|nr:TonB-dependent receptor [Sphingobium boeckii]MBB5684850.1 iron complex outermembrane receptor protein [Sphingobium boeckii]
MKIKFAASTAMLLLAMPALAQETSTSADSGTAEGQATDDSAGMGEIIVTAQRRSESLQKVPLSVNAVTADTLSDRNINGLDQLPLVAPSLQIGLLGNYSIRGVGTLANSSSVDSSVAVAIDDVNLGQPGYAINLFNDVQRVEVLNGPQGLLFGRNASAGLMNIVTGQPEIGVTENIFNVETGARGKPGVPGDANYVLARETINLPVGSNTAIRLNGFYSYAEPVMTLTKRTAARQDEDQRQYGIRAKLLTNFSDRLSLYLIGEYAKSHGGSTTDAFTSVGTGPSIIRPILAADGITANSNNFLISADGAFYRDRLNVGAQGTLSYDLGGGWNISNIAAWKRYKDTTRFDIDRVSADILNTNLVDQNYTQFSNELRLALPSGNRLGGQVGLYYFDATMHRTLLTSGSFNVPAVAQPNAPFCVGTGPTPGCASRNLFVIGRDIDYRLDNRSYAAFGQLTYELTDGLMMIGGARLTRDELHMVQAQNQNNYFRFLGVRATYDQSFGNTDFSYKAGLQYQVTPDVMGYATYARGYKGPGVNDNGATVTSNLVVRPETSKNIEAGIKSSWLDRRLIINVALFHSKFTDFQTQSFNAAVTAFVIQNAASLTSKGGEVTVIAKPFAGLTINANASYIDSKFGSFPGAQCYPGQPTPGCSTIGSFNASGFRTPTTPRFTSTVQAKYETDIGGGASAFIDGNWYHRASINYNINEAPASAVGPIDIFGASIGVQVDAMQFSIFCKNCTNKHYPLYIAADPIDATVNTASFLSSFGYDSVRTIGISGTFRF